MRPRRASRTPAPRAHPIASSTIRVASARHGAAVPRNPAISPAIRLALPLPTSLEASSDAREIASGDQGALTALGVSLPEARGGLAHDAKLLVGLVEVHRVLNR